MEVFFLCIYTCIEFNYYHIPMSKLNTLISNKTTLPTSIVQAIISLIEEGNTIPFIARYRKEVTGGATDTQLRDFEDIYNIIHVAIYKHY